LGLLLRASESSHPKLFSRQDRREKNNNVNSREEGAKKKTKKITKGSIFPTKVDILPEKESLRSFAPTLYHQEEQVENKQPTF